MIFTTIVCLEVILFVTWLVYKIAGMIRRHKILFSIIIIGIVYLMISGHSSNVVNINSQKNNNLANTVHADGSVLDNSINSSSAVELLSVVYLGNNRHETGADGHKIVHADGSITSNSIDSNSAVELQSVLYPGDNCHETGADGHRIILHNNESAINPTYWQLADFIKSDKTDEVQYNYSSFACTDFAERVHNNAEDAGYKCAWVKINFVNGGAIYACNVFDTVDRGLIFTDCTNYGNPDNDKTVNLKVGKEYSPECIGDSSYIYYSLGIVKNYQIYW